MAVPKRPPTSNDATEVRLLPLSICALDLKPCYTPCRFGHATNKKRCLYHQPSYLVLGDTDAL